MISDAEMSELPVDPELAFVQFEKILRERVQEMETQEAASGGFDADSYRLEYMNKVHAAAKVFGIEALANLAVPKADRNSSIAEQYRQFVTGVDYVTIQIRLHSARSNRQGSVGLDDTTRAKIHHFIKQIREAIGQSDLPDDKRDALYDKLNKFASEVDKARTALQAGMAVYIAVCDAIGQGFQKLEPARKWFDSIGALLGRAKECEDRADHRLPPPPERKRLEPPPERPVPKSLSEDVRAKGQFWPSAGVRRVQLVCAVFLGLDVHDSKSYYQSPTAASYFLDHCNVGAGSFVRFSFGSPPNVRPCTARKGSRHI